MSEPTACLNCAQPFGAPRPRYCPACGQETNVKPPTLREFAQQFGGHYIAAEGALWRSLKLLLLRPGALTREYLEGRRRRYVLPLRLYLTISLVALLVLRFGAHFEVRTNQGGQMHRVTTEQMLREMHDFDVLEIGSRRAGVRGGKFFCENLPAWLCGRLERRLGLEPRAFAAEVAALPERFIEHFGSAMFLLLPLFAVGLKLVYLNRHLRFTEHLVFALHLHAFWFFALALTTVPFKPLAALAGLAMPVYEVLAARRVYGGRWGPTLLRSAALAAGYGSVLALALAVVGMWAFLA